MIQHIATFSDGDQFSIQTIDSEGCTASYQSDLIECTKNAVELLYFRGRKDGPKNILEWESKAEIEHSHYELKRSADTYEWETIATLYGIGTETTGAFYEYLDKDVEAETSYYYRLEAEGLNGQIESTVVILIKAGRLSNALVQYGNLLSVSSVTPFDLYVFNAAMQMVDQFKAVTEQSIDLSVLPNGMYFVLIEKNGFREFKKVLVSN